jgi:hypothetical protein
MFRKSQRMKQRDRNKEVNCLLQEVRFPANHQVAAVVGSRENCQSNTEDFECCNLSSDEFSNNELQSNISVASSGSTDSLDVCPVVRKCDKTLSEGLRHWVVKHDVTHAALRDLLEIINDTTESVLPRDPRTIMQTPREINISCVSGGTHAYFGVTHQIISRITDLSSLVNPDCNPFVSQLNRDFNGRLISLSIGVDGVPISRSNNKQFWPLLGIIDQLHERVPFLIGLFFGETKPSDTEFLRQFVEECKCLENEGIQIKNQNFSFRISCLLADAPARSFVKGTKNHNSYSGCCKCNAEGSWFGRVVYLDTEFTRRTDHDFLMRLDDSHHTSISILSEIKFGLVTQVPYDYMHLVCLGVVRKLLRQWVKGKLPHRMKSSIVNCISKELLAIKRFVPKEIHRKPRRLNEVDHFKATEFRTFILYTGIVALSGNLPKKYYDHFMLLHAAMVILLSKNASNVEWNGLSRRLITRFVIDSREIYGPEFLVYNVHGLLHLPDDALRFGNLDNVSAFPYENYMQKLKKTLHSRNYHLEQASKRIIEMNNVAISPDATKVDRNVLSTSLSQLDVGNNCFVLKSGDIICIQDVIKRSNYQYKIEFRKFLNRSNFPCYPFESSSVGIYCVNNLSETSICVLNECDISYKCVVLPYKNEHVIIPLLHTLQ